MEPVNSIDLKLSDAEDAVAQLVAAGIPAAVVKTYGEAATGDVARERDMLQRVAVEGNADVPVQGPVPKFSRTPVSVRSGAPALGEATDDILRELGFEADERERLRGDGVTVLNEPTE